MNLNKMSRNLNLVFLFLILLSSQYANAQNPLSSSSGFGVITEGNFSITQGDIEGSIAVGGNLNVLGNAQRTSANATGGISYVTYAGTQYALIVGGGLSGVNGGNIFKVDGKGTSTTDHNIRFNTLSGSTAAAGSGGIDIGNPVTNNLNRYVRVNNTAQTAASVVNTTSLFNFATAFADFRTQASSMSACTGNVTPTGTGTITLNLGANSTNVWNVTGATLNSYTSITLTGNLPSATRPLVINVNASGVFNWNNLKFNMGSETDNAMEINRAPYIIWNFYNATTLTTTTAQLILGSILAPDANFTPNASGNIAGQVIVKTFTKPQAGEIHIAAFNTNVTCAVACNNVTSGGTIGSDQTTCGTSYDPALITNITLPSGGGTGTIQYLWLSSLDGGTTTSVIAGATNSTYDPPVISQTTWYRRCARRAGCTNYDGESNWVMKELTTCCPGTITGLYFADLSGGGINTTIVNGGSYDINTLPTSYILEASYTGTIPSVVFTVSGSASYTNTESTAPYNSPATGSSWTYGAGTYTVTAQVYTATAGGGTVCNTYTTWFTLTVPVCNNVTNSGVIGYNESSCSASFDPALIQSLSLPSGGNTSAAIEYLWLKSTDAGVTNTVISGATNATYDPPTITVNTWYRRCSRRAGCSSYDGESNWVEKIISTCPSCVNNLVNNPGFEQGINFWDYSGGVLSAGTGAIHSGTHSGDFQITNTTSNWASQEIFLPNYTLGTTLNLSVYAGTHDNSVWHGVGFDYFDANWTWISGNSATVNKVLATAPAGPQLYTVTGTLPANVAHVSVWFSGSGGWIKTDDWCVTLSTCNNVTSGGTIGNDESICGTSLDPANIVNVTLPSGGNSNTIEYIWLVSTDGGTTNSVIAGATNSTYDPGVITQTTWYRRCSRRAGCTNYDGESNWIIKEIKLNTTTTTTASACNSYTWSANSQTYTTSGVYTFTSLNAAGCVNTATLNLTINTSPVGTITSSLTIPYCNGLSVTLTAPAASTYSWSTGATTQTITVTPLQSTIYTVTATSSAGCTATATKVVYFASCGVCANNLLTNPSFEQGFTAPTAVQQLQTPAPGWTGGNSEMQAYNASWETPDGTAFGWPTASSPIMYQDVNAIVGNTYTLKFYTRSHGTGGTPTITLQYLTSTNTPIGTASTYTVTNSAAWSTLQTLTLAAAPSNAAKVRVSANGATVSATVFNPAKLDGVCLTTSCTNTTTGNINATACGSYTWSANGQTYTNSGTYTYTSSNGNGCINTATLTLTIVNIVADAGVDKSLNCTTTSSIIGTSAIAGNTYSWSPATGLSSTSIAQPTANPVVTTTYTVTVTGSNGCTATDAIVVTVNKTTPTADAGVDKNLNCTTTSTAIGTTAIAGNTYLWSNGVTSATQTVNPTTTTSYTVTVTGSNGCTASDVVVVNVNTTTPTADAGVDKNLNCTTTSTTIGTTAIAGNTYLWSNGATTATQTVNPTVTTSYTVTVTGSNGCTASDVVVVNVNTTTPTADAGVDKNLNCTTTSTTIGTTAIAGNTYLWSNGATSATQIVNPTTTTSYTVTVTGSNGCTASDVVVVNVNTITPTADAGVDKNLNCTTTSTTIGTTAIAGNTYLWSNGATSATQTVNPTVTTSYTVTVTGSNGCTASDVVIVNVNTTTPTADAGVDKNLNCTTTSTTIGTTAIAGNTYLWSNGATSATQTVNPTTTTSYTVTVTGSNGCTTSDVVVVNVNTTTPTADAGVDKNLNCTTTSTTIGTTAIAGNTYLWSNGATSATQTVNPTTTTSYTVTVTGSNGCTASDVVVVNVNTTTPTADAGVDKNLNCTTTSTTIGTTAIAGNTYLWSNGATSATQTVNPTTTTSYTVTVTGSNGCTASDVVVVNVNTTTPTADAGVDKNLNCTTTSTTIGTTAIAGNTYLWSNGATSATQTVNPTVTTSYTVTVTGSNGCTASDVVVVNVNTTTPMADAGVDKNLNCTTTSTTIGTTAIAGNTYLWSNGTTSATQTVNPTTTTSYTVTVTGSNGCTASDVVVVNVNTTTPTANAGVDKNLNCTTTSTTIGTTAIAGNTYLWSNGATSATQTVNPTSTTSYTVTVTGSNGCTASDVVVVNVNTTTPTADAGVDKNLNCTTTSTTIGTTAIAGNTYLWSNGATSATQTVNPTTTTSYTVTVTGSNGCTASDVVVVNVNTTTPTADAGIDKNLNCTTTSTTIGTTAIAGNTYLWSNGATTATQTVNPAITTSYTVTVTGSNGCTASDVVVVNVNTTTPTADAGVDKNLNCTTTSTTIGTTAIAGNTYLWSNGATSATQTVNPTTTTSYTVTVTGSNGCTASDVVVVNVNTTAPTVDAGNDKEINCNELFVTLELTVVPGVTYSWSPAAGLNSTTTAQPTATPTVTTSYTVTATNANGCTATDVVIVVVNTTPPIANAGLDKNLNCATTSTVIGTTAIAGNNYVWSPSTGLSSTSIAQPTANPTVTTSYTVTVTGSNGCTASDVVVVNVNTTTPMADAGVDKNLNCTTTSTTIGTTAIAGNTYLWSNGATTATQTVNPAITSSYTVTVTGSNGCTASDVVVVNVNTSTPLADAGSDKTLTCAIPSAMIGTPAVVGNTYIWNPSTGLSSTSIAQPIASPSVSTSYTVTVSSANGCSSTDVVLVTVIPNLISSGINGPSSICATEPAFFQVVNPNITYTYSWSATGGATASGSQNTGSETYVWPVSAQNTIKQVSLVVTDSNGCTQIYTHTINITTAVFANAGTDKEICQGGNAVLGASPSGPAGATFNWAPNFFINSTSVANPTVNPPVSTTYTLTTTLNGCVRSDIVVVNVNVLLGPGADAGPTNVTVCSGGSTVVLGGSPTSATPFVSYLWTPSTGLNNATIANPTLTPVNSGWYKVRVTSSAGCYNEDSIFVTVDPNCYVTLSGNVFVDNNGPTNVDGTGTGTAGTTQLYANLTTPAGIVITSIPVNANGTYTFGVVPINTNYNVVLTSTQGTTGSNVPSTTLPTGWSNVSEDCCDNTGNDGTTNGTTSVVVGTTNVINVNFGITEPLSLGNTVWNDINKNGTKDAGENGISGVTVNLYIDANNDGTPDGAAVATTTTNSTGNYIFNGLTPGNYIVGVVPPSPASGAPYTSSPVNEANPNNNVDNNDNGVTTTSGQTYSGTIALAAGTEPLGELPNNGTAPDVNSNLTLDFGFYQAIDINGNVFIDNNGATNVDGTGSGTAGATQLYANLVDAAGNVVASVAVNANGTYNFTDVQPNTTYTMVLSTTAGTVGSPAPSTTLPTGWSNVSEDCCDNTGNDGTTNGTTTVVVGTATVNNVNFGITEPLSLGNTVWNDINKNGTKDAGENGISGVTVNLYIDANNDGTPDGAAVATTTTNSTGNYIFNGLTPGNYIVGVVPPSPASGAPYTSSPVNEANPNNNVDNNDNGVTTTSGQTYSGTIALAAGTEPLGELPNNGTAPDVNSNLTLDFGFYQAIDINGNVFIDNNGATNVDGTGSGTAGATQLYANLVDAAGNVVASVAVNANGTYNFTDVQPNTTYTMVLSTTAGTVGSPAPSTTLPTGWSNVSEDCCDNTGNDGTTNGTTTVVVGTATVNNVNFGITEPLSLGNTVWSDLNQNGIKDAGENGISGATVNLYVDANNDGTPDGAAVATTTTNSTGNYIFNGLTPGNYIVGVVPPAPTSGNAFVSSPVNEANPNNNIDNNDNGVTTTLGQTYSGTIALSSGTEPLGELPNNGTAPDVNSNLTLDFGFYQPITLAGNVFIDNNGPNNVDGIGTGTASSVQLYANLVNAAGNVVASVAVNANGTYNFNNVQPNTTFTMVLSTIAGTVGSPAPSTTLPSGWINVSEDCCDNTGNDGTTNGMTTVTVGTSDVSNVNFGIREPLSLGNLVWNDLNKNGLKDPIENGISGAEVNLYSDNNSDGAPDGAAIASTITNSNGLYVFNDLFEGNYIVGVIPPLPAVGNDYESSNQGEEFNPNNNVDNNDNGIIKVAGETISGTITLAFGTEPTGETPNNAASSDNNANLTVDFGFYQPIDIAGNVFVDNNGPANVDGTGIGTPNGVQLFANLVNASGNVIAVAPVNPNGTFIFTDVQPNTTFTVILSTLLGNIGNPAPLPNLPSGWANVSEDCCDNTGNDGTTNGITTVVVLQNDVVNVNFGIKEPLSLGNLVWQDINSDGLKSSTEPGIPGATVKLYADANNDGSPDGAALQTTTTNSNGNYVFNGLDQGNYIVGVIPPTGSVYTSSVNGQEINPNLNIDNNDNGIVTIAGETFSGTVILLAGTEPLGETPNNGTAPDINSNLTVDFGFFICPGSFTFNPQLVCPGNTINLIAMEPVNYTGGVWSQGGNPVTQTNVGAGVYLYTYQNGGCTATGTLTIGVNVPDYTPTITIAPSAITGNSGVRVIINISEILNKPSCSPIYIFVPKLEPRFTFSYEPTATTIGGIPVTNSDWQYFSSNPNFYVWQYVGSSTFPANGSSKLGFLGPYDPSQTDGATTFSVQIFQGSGGETNLTNNTDSENLIYFR